MTLEELHDLSSKDLEIKQDQLIEESLRTPSLFSKYNKILSQEKLLLKKLEFEFKKAQKESWEYFSGKSEPKVYKEKPLGHKLMKGQIEKYMDADPELEKVSAKLVLQQEKVEAIERIMKQINDRQWIIRNVNETLKFQAGI